MWLGLLCILLKNACIDHSEKSNDTQNYLCFYFFCYNILIYKVLGTMYVCMRVHSLTVFPGTKGAEFASSGEDGTVRVWNGEYWRRSRV